MYDYLKIDCQGTYFLHWLNNERLCFPLSVDERTGEVLNRKREAELKNLVFRVTPSEVDKEVKHCTIMGSFHQYFNDGKHNANHFTINDFRAIVADMKNHYDVIPKQSVIRNFEYGINIILPNETTVKKLLRSVISLPTKRFVNLKMEASRIGKIASFGEYDLKLYDKGEHAGSLKNRLLRIELRIKKTRFLEQYGIKESRKPLSLYDLAQPRTASKIGEVLYNLVSDIIFIDKSLNKNNLTQKELLSLARFENPMYWEELNRKKRYKEKLRCKQLIEKCNPTGLFEEVKKRTFELLELLTDSQHKKGDVLTKPKHDFAAHKKGTFSRYKYRGISSPPTSSKTGLEKFEKVKEKTNPETPRNLRTCLTCGRDISHQRKNSRFCSETLYGKKAKACRNASSNITRTTNRRNQAEKESKLLNEIKNKILNDEIKITITYKSGKVKRTAALSLKPMTFRERRTVVRVRVRNVQGVGVVVLTSIRAKEFIRIVQEKHVLPKLKNDESKRSKSQKSGSLKPLCKGSYSKGHS